MVVVPSMGSGDSGYRGKFEVRQRDFRASYKSVLLTYVIFASNGCGAARFWIDIGPITYYFLIG